MVNTQILLSYLYFHSSYLLRFHSGYIQFIVKEVPDTLPQLLDNVLRILLQLLTTWRNTVTAATHKTPQEEQPSSISVSTL